MPANRQADQSGRSADDPGRVRQRGLAGKALEKRVKQLMALQTLGRTESDKPVKEIPLFQFTWRKDAEILIKARYSAEKPLDAYFAELREALEEFLTRPYKAAAGAGIRQQEVAVAA